MKVQMIEATGDDRQVGRAHARGAPGMRSAVVDWVAAAQAAHPLSDLSVRGRVDEVIDAWQTLTPATLEQITGIAEIYGLESEDILVALLATYLDSGNRAAGVRVAPGGPRGSLDGCTALTLGGPAPLLAKNRDNDPRFLEMQTVLRVRPARGYRWLALSTAGAPAVHSSGMNELGLSVADTHVPSTDIGPGMPRFSSMMHVLQECSTTPQAVELLTSTPQMGLGTISIVDEHGSAAVVECGYRTTVATTLSSMDEASGLVATNHYTQPALSSCNLVAEDGSPAVSSRSRRATVATLLARATVDRAGVDEVMSSHIGFDGSDGAIGSVCAHGPTAKSETISTVVFDPVARHMDISLGRPCQGTYTRIPVVA